MKGIKYIHKYTNKHREKQRDERRRKCGSNCIAYATCSTATNGHATNPRFPSSTTPSPTSLYHLASLLAILPPSSS